VNIVFVHLNTKLPRYLQNNLKRTAKEFTSHKVFLIHNLDRTPKIPGVNFFKTHTLASLGSTEASLNHPKEFRKNFWFTSIARLIVFPEFMEVNPEPLIHVESDVTIAEDFPFEEFLEIDEAIAFPIVFKERAVASTVYIRDISQARDLADFVLNEIELNNNTTDMLTLRRYFDCFPKKVFPLPFFYNIDSRFIHEIDPVLQSRLTECKSRFNGIFDGSDLGVFYFGTDPRNARGLSTIRKEVQFTNLKLPAWELILMKNRVFPFAVFDMKRVPIYSLHITSKRPEIFTAHMAKFFMSRYLRSQNKGSRKQIILRVLLKQSILSVKRRLSSTRKE
jgi:hypothetical protein